MPRPTLSEIIDGRLIADDSEMYPSDDEPVRAIDVLEPYAAVYRFSADEGGLWYASCALACRADDGAWRETGSSGTHGAALELPWKPSSQTLNGHTIAIYGSVGMDVGDGTSTFLRSIFGFVHPSVRHLRVRTATSERVIEVRSPVGAFAVLVLSDSAVDLQGLNEAGEDVGQPANARPIEDLPRRRFRRRNWRTRGWRFGRT